MLRLTSRVGRRFATGTTILDYNDLKKGADLHKEIETAYGHQGLGLLVVKNIPGYVEARANLLPQAYRLATLPATNLKKLMRPEIFHSKGWSCGVEQFHGKFDTSKGSFYSNCVIDVPPALTPEEKKHYSETELKLRVPNVWVDELP